MTLPRVISREEFAARWDRHEVRFRIWCRRWMLHGFVRPAKYEGWSDALTRRHRWFRSCIRVAGVDPPPFSRFVRAVVDLRAAGFPPPARRPPLLLN